MNKFLKIMKQFFRLMSIFWKSWTNFRDSWTFVENHEPIFKIHEDFSKNIIKIENMNKFEIWTNLKSKKMNNFVI
jgi:hypothetical protein